MSTASSLRSSRPKATEWGWGSRSRARSSRLTTAACGARRTPPAAASFTSSYRPTPPWRPAVRRRATLARVAETRTAKRSFWTKWAVLGTGGGCPCRGSPFNLVGPRPLIDLGLVDPVFVGVALAVDLHVAQLLLDVRAGDPQALHPIDDVDREAEPVDLVTNGQIERRVDVALLFVAAYVQVLVIGAPVGQPMDQPGIPVEVEDDWLVHGEQAVEVPVRQAVRVLAGGRELQQVDDVDEANLQIGEVLPQHHDRRERLLGRDVAGTGHHHIRLRALVVARLRPDAEALRAVFDRLLHGHVLQVLLLVRHDHVDVVGAPETVVGHAEQRIRIGRQVDATHIGALVQDQVDESRILVREAVVVLAPYRRGDEQIE